MAIVICGVLILAVLSFRLMTAFHLQRWQITAALLVLGVFLHVFSAFLTKAFIQRRALDFANDQDWELTAGLGIVPKWVSAIGLVALSAVVTAVLPWVVAIFRSVWELK